MDRKKNHYDLLNRVRIINKNNRWSKREREMVFISKRYDRFTA